MSLQQQLADLILRNFENASIKKIDKDNYLDIHLPMVNNAKGTHLFFNTSKGNISIGFYCRDTVFVNQVLKLSDEIEEYSQGIRPVNNPKFNDLSEAYQCAVKFIQNMIGDVSNEQNTEKEMSLILSSEFEGALCEVIKEYKLLLNFSFIPNFLRNKGFHTDSKTCFFYTENIEWGENGERWDLLLDMNGFSSSRNSNEFTLLFDWDSVHDVKLKLNQDDNSVVVGLFQADGEFLTLEQKQGQSLRIIHYLYYHIWQNVIERFKDQPMIIWNELDDMGITLKNLESYEQFYDMFE